MDRSTPGLPVHHQLLELLRLVSTESVMPSNHLTLCRPLLLLPLIFPSIRVFSNESALHIRYPKYCSFGFSLSPSNEYSGLISFRMDWFGPLAIQGTLKSLLQHHSSKASVLQCSALWSNSNQSRVSCTSGGFLTNWAIREAMPILLSQTIHLLLRPSVSTGPFSMSASLLLSCK